MTPQEKQLLEEVNTKLNHLIDIYHRVNLIDKTVFTNPVYFNGKAYVNGSLVLKDGVTVATGSTTGATIGATGDKIGFLGHAPIARQSAITAPSGGATVDSQARTAIGTIITVLQSFGLTS